MISWLIERVMLTGVSEKWARIAVFVGAGCLAALLCVGLRACYDNRVISGHETEIKEEVLERTADANDRSADQRAKDAVENYEKEERRKDAIEKTADEKPSAPARALGCDRLREAGYDTSRFPACK